MPTFRRLDEKPIVQFDPRLEVSPFVLFRRLREDRAPRLVDVEPDVGDKTLRGAETVDGEDWRPADPDEEVVLLDRAGERAVGIADRLQKEGYERVKALFGGLELYEFSLDPEVVGDDTFLEARQR